MSVIEPKQEEPQNKAAILSFEPYHFANNLPPETREKLKEIFANWSDTEKAEAMVREIIDNTPDTLGVRIVAYRFYFYRRRSLEAAHWALSIMEWLSIQLNIPADWREVTAEMADFVEWHAYTRLWLQSLTAYSYNLARLGRIEEALAALDKIVVLDSMDKLGAAHLRQVYTSPHRDAGMVFPKAFENLRFHRNQDY
jgi:tetratricopeptide (TPR) repeat protein